MENFSERLKTMRADSGKRQKDIADAMGITSRAYQYYENGTTSAVPTTPRSTDNPS